MRRWIAGLASASLLGIIELSCNSIAGLDGVDLVQCLTESDCQMLGECVKVSCDDGFCRHELVTLRTSCSAGICDEEARCVECIEPDDCKADPFSTLCTDDGRCVECITSVDCPTTLRPKCFNDVCVECVSDAECPGVPEPCLEAKCASGVCLVAAKPAQETCTGGECDGKGDCVCDGKGECIPDLSN